jgi:hypothetical protein
MPLFSDLLPYLLQQPQLPGGPQLGPPIAKSPTNVSPMNMPSAKLPDPFGFANSMTNMANVFGENRLRAQQANLTDVQAQNLAWMLRNKPEGWRQMMAGVDALTKLGQQGGGQGASIGSIPGVGDMTAAGGGGNRELATFNYGGLRNPNVPVGGGPNTNPQGWQSFKSPEEGVQAIVNQLDRYAAGEGVAKTPKTTLNDIITLWAPPNENDTAALINRASTVMGIKPDEKIDFSDPLQKAKLVEAMIRNEQGGNLPPDAAGVIPKVLGARNYKPYSGPQLVQLPSGGSFVGTNTSQTQPLPVPNSAFQSGSIPPEQAAPSGDRSAFPEVPTHDLGGPAPEAEGEDKQSALSPRERLNQQILARSRVNETQVADASGGIGAGADWGAGNLGSMPPSMQGLGRSPGLSAPFSPAAQQAASPSPAVPTGGNVPMPSAPTPGPTMPGASPALPGAPAGGFQIDPAQAALLKAAISGQMVGLPGGQELLQAYYNSPYFQAQQARAKAQVGLEYAGPMEAARKAVELQYAAPLAEANEGVKLKYAYPIAVATAMADWAKPEWNVALRGQIAGIEAQAKSGPEAIKELWRPHLVNNQLVIPAIAMQQMGIPMPGQPGAPAPGIPGAPAATGAPPQAGVISAPASLPPVSGATVPTPPPPAPTVGVGVPGLGGAPPAAGQQAQLNPAASGPGVISGGMTDVQRIGLEGAMRFTEEQLKPYAETAQTSRQQAGIAEGILDLLPRVRMGWGADTIQEGAKIMSALGVPDSIVNRFSHPEAGDDLNKLFLQYTSGVVRGMGAREPGSVINMFQRNYPNLETHPQAAQLMVQALRMQSRWAADRATAAQQWANNQRLNMGQYGEKYQGMAGFEDAFDKTNNYHDYWRAAAAMANEPDIAWKGLNEAGQHRVFNLIPAGSMFYNDRGVPYTKPGAP